VLLRDSINWMADSMLRHSGAPFRALVAAMLLALATGGCGIKGPLVPPPKPDAAKDATQAPASRKP
jgi:predicted small lipoprotein YifL